MLPIVLDPAAIVVGLVGQGGGLMRRLDLLERSGVQPRVFDGNTPCNDVLTGLSVLFVAGLEEGSSRELAAAARALGVLVNVEDQPALCDFHVPASVHRGDLLLTVSTRGQSPALARLLREKLDREFGPEWSERVEELARKRLDWRGAGADPSSVSDHTLEFVTAKGWL